MGSGRRAQKQGGIRRAVLETLEQRQMFAASPIYSYDGTGNNLTNTNLGAAGQNLIHIAGYMYGDGISTPAGANRASARLISNILSSQTDDVVNDRNVTDWIYGWGQFIDHDLGKTGTNAGEAMHIAVPTGDTSFDPTSTGTKIIPMSRSTWDTTTGTSTSNPRAHVNSVTSWIDGSMVYGSDQTRADALRTFKRGLMKTSAGDLLPLNSDGLAMNNDAHRVPDTELFLAGDVRANENVQLSAIQTLFVREHNRLARKIGRQNPGMKDEAIYQRARKLVIAEIQQITFKEYLPALMGSGAIAAYTGYNQFADPRIAAEFSAGAYRMGHTQLNSAVEFADNDGNESSEELPFRDAFSNPQVLKDLGPDSMYKYLASDNSMEVDLLAHDDFRNFLFGPPGSGGLDLMAIDVQRGRDMGLADYNTMRAAYGLARVTSFAEISSDVDVQNALQTAYGSVDNIDMFMGGLAEDHVADSSLGELFQAIVKDQFQRTRDADRLWWENTLKGNDRKFIEGITLAEVIKKNSELTNLQDNVFFFEHGMVCGKVFADANQNGRRDVGEKVFSNVTVELRDVHGNLVDTTTTDATGEYKFVTGAVNQTFTTQAFDVGPQGRDTKVGYAYLVLDETNGRFGVDLAIKKKV